MRSAKTSSTGTSSLAKSLSPTKQSAAINREVTESELKQKGSSRITPDDVLKLSKPCEGTLYLNG